MRILGIETSCDETSAAIIEGNTDKKTVKLLSNVVTSSLNLHKKTGGIIPEIAAREQVKYIIPVIEKALKNSNLYPPSSKNHHLSSTIYRPNIDAIAVTVGPGLIGSLLVGVETARTLSYVWQKPIIPVNHLIGHIYANWINPSLSVLGSRSSDSGQSVNQLTGKLKTDKPVTENRQRKTDNRIPFPALTLIVSGGHTDLVLLKDHGRIKWLGGTRDDAAGEAFDKIGRLLGLPYPGGPAIEKAAKNGNPKAFNLPRPMIDSNDFDFSFSGLKTSVLYLIRRNPKVSVILGSEATPESLRALHDKGDSGQARMTKIHNILISNLSASIQQSIIDVLISKTLKATQKYKVKSILLCGGVAANQKLRDELKLNARRYVLDAKIFAPAKNLCTDNGAMIASAAFFNYKEISWRTLTANPELYFD